MESSESYHPYDEGAGIPAPSNRVLLGGVEEAKDDVCPGVDDEIPHKKKKLSKDRGEVYFCGSTASERRVLNCLFASKAALADKPEVVLRECESKHSLNLDTLEFDAERRVLRVCDGTDTYIAIGSSNLLQNIVTGSAVAPVCRYGALVHSGFFYKAQELLSHLWCNGFLPRHFRSNNQSEVNSSSEMSETLPEKRTAHPSRSSNCRTIFCGHSTSGTLASLCALEILYANLSEKNLEDLARIDQWREDEGPTSSCKMQIPGELWHSDRALWNHDALRLPMVCTVTFGSPFPCTEGVNDLLHRIGRQHCFLNVVMESDIVPSILNVAQSASLLRNTAKLLSTLLKGLRLVGGQYLPDSWTALLLQKGKKKGAYSYYKRSNMLLSEAFAKLEEYLADLAPRMAPFGASVILLQDFFGFEFAESSSSVVSRLTLSGRHLLGTDLAQHAFSRYEANVMRRTQNGRVTVEMNFYERLRIPQTASSKEIRRAYKKVALQWHPDRWASTMEEDRRAAEQCFKLVSEAYEVLYCPETKADYDEKLRKGTAKDWIASFFTGVSGTAPMTTEKALRIFVDMLESMSNSQSNQRAGSEFSVLARSSGSSGPTEGLHLPVRGPRSGPQAPSLTPNNHENILLPDKIKINRPLEDGSARIMYVDSMEVLPGDVPHPSERVPQAFYRGKVAALGGAVAVGAGVALAVTAWNKYKEANVKFGQAEEIKNVSDEVLLQALRSRCSENNGCVSFRERFLQLEDGRTADHDRCMGPDAEKGQLGLISKSQLDAEGGALVGTSKEACNALVIQFNPNQEEVDSFYDCLDRLEDSEFELEAQDQFHECLGFEREVNDIVHSSFTITESTEEHSLDIDPRDLATDQRKESIDAVSATELPYGVSLSTPYGIGNLEDLLLDAEGQCLAVIILFENGPFAYRGFIQPNLVKPGALQAFEHKKKEAKDLRENFIAGILRERSLHEDQIKREALLGTLWGATAGAVDSGIKATGGLLLAGGAACIADGMAGAAAPVAIASILVDVGREYLSFREKRLAKASEGTLCEIHETLIMEEFRHKVGHHVIAGTTAAVGAGMGVYSVSIAGLALAGLPGTVALTGVALAGGVVGYFTGTSAYQYFMKPRSERNRFAQENIDKLAAGARVLFDEFDDSKNGLISKNDCKTLIGRLQTMLKDETSRTEVQKVLDYLNDEDEDYMVSWTEFWNWVSRHTLKSLEERENKLANEIRKVASLVSRGLINVEESQKLVKLLRGNDQEQQAAQRTIEVTFAAEAMNS